MESLQIAEHLCVVQAGGRTIRRPITLDAGIWKQGDGFIRGLIIAIQGILKAESFRLVFQGSEVLRSDASYVQWWSRLERET